MKVRNVANPINSVNRTMDKEYNQSSLQLTKDKITKSQLLSVCLSVAKVRPECGQEVLVRLIDTQRYVVVDHGSLYFNTL